MDVSNALEQIKNEFPHIRPYEEDDLEWWNQGLDLIDAGRLDQAEETFEKLTLSQPNHPDGVEGLAMVYTKKTDPHKAKIFYREAIRRAEARVEEGSMDPECVQRLRSDLDRLLKT